MSTESETSPPQEMQAPQRARLFLLIGIPILAAYGIAALRNADWALLGLIAANTAIIGGSYLALLRGHIGPATIRPGIAAYAALLLYMVAFSGEEHGHALWFFSFPLVSIMLLPPREGLIWSALCIAGAAIIMMLGGTELGTSTYSLAFASRFAITAVMIAGGTFWSEIVLRRYQEETVAQRHATEAESIRLKKEIERRTALEANLRVLATTDALTGLVNRRSFMERLGQEVARAQRHGQTPTLMMLDVDHFKKINDKYGHPAGDAVLVHLGHLLKASLRNVDIVGRLGGEEFGLVLVDTNAEMAAPVIERLLEQLRQTTVTLADATTIKFTASIGSTEILWGDTVDTAIQRADEALYTAKNSGRDRHCKR
jgi:diguanylate cyclase (GGDEF)-like protein